MLWWLLPFVMWWFSAKVALAMTKSVPADPSVPVFALTTGPRLVQ